jgi:DNA-binding transcriptional LysR family regulator
VRGLLAAAQAVPSREAVVRERSTQLALVAAGLGSAIVPAGAAALRPGDIAYRPLREATPVLTTIAAWRTDDDDPVVRRVLARIGPAVPGVSDRTVTAAVAPD